MLSCSVVVVSLEERDSCCSASGSICLERCESCKGSRRRKGAFVVVAAVPSGGQGSSGLVLDMAHTDYAMRIKVVGRDLGFGMAMAMAMAEQVEMLLRCWPRPQES